MKRYLFLLLALILLLGGGYFGYQFFKIELKARVSQVLLQYAWHKTIKTGEDQRPWKNFDGIPILRLTIPRHEVDQIVLAGTSGQSLAFGTAFHSESKPPGSGGITVLSSHVDSHGLFIKKLIKGDLIKLQDQYNKWHVYSVDDLFILNIKKETIALSEYDERLLIITCYPFDALIAGTPYRYVVSAKKNLI